MKEKKTKAKDERKRKIIEYRRVREYRTRKSLKLYIFLPYCYAIHFLVLINIYYT